MIHSLISLFVVTALLSTGLSILPAMVALAISTCAFLAWNVMPDEIKIEIKTAVGLGKKSYQEPTALSIS